MKQPFACWSGRTQWEEFVYCDVWSLSQKTGGRNFLKCQSLTCLVVDAGFQLRSQFLSPWASCGGLPISVSSFPLLPNPPLPAQWLVSTELASQKERYCLLQCIIIWGWHHSESLIHLDIWEEIFRVVQGDWVINKYILNKIINWLTLDGQ